MQNTIFTSICFTKLIIIINAYFIIIKISNKKNLPSSNIVIQLMIGNYLRVITILKILDSYLTYLHIYKMMIPFKFEQNNNFCKTI